MLETLLTPPPNKSAYDFETPGTFIARVKVENSVGKLEVSPSRFNSSGLYGTSQLPDSPVAYYPFSYRPSSLNSTLFVNSTNAIDTKVGSEFSIECYLGKPAGSVISSVQHIVMDRNPNTGPYVPPSPYPNNGTYAIYIGARGILRLSLKNKANTYILNNHDTGVDIYSLLSSVKLTHFLFQVKEGYAQVYLNGSLLTSVPCPGFDGGAYAEQVCFGNNSPLTQPATNLVFDEVRFSNNLARASGEFIPPKVPFIS